MTSRRFVSLYYGSIRARRAVRAVWMAVTTPSRSGPSQRADLASAVNDALRTGATPVFAFSSARGALAACLRGAGLSPGDEVVLSAYSCLAVPIAVVASGATPVYCDIDPETLNVTRESVCRAITERTRAVVVQHTLGSVAPVGAIIDAIGNRPIVVIEDCALSIGTRTDGVLAGTTGHAAIISMELSKTLSSGWGGVLLVRDESLAERVAAVHLGVPESGTAAARRDMIQTGVSALCHIPSVYDRFGKYVLYLAFRFGWFRRSTSTAELRGDVGFELVHAMSAPQARFAAVQWRDFAGVAKACAANEKRLRAELNSRDWATPGAPRPGDQPVTPRVSWLVRDRSQASRFFLERGVELGEWFNGPMSPVPTAPIFNYFPGSYPNAERIASQVVNLPCHSGVSEKAMDRMLSVLRQFAREHPDSLVRRSKLTINDSLLATHS